MYHEMYVTSFKTCCRRCTLEKKESARSHWMACSHASASPLYSRRIVMYKPVMYVVVPVTVFLWAILAAMSGCLTRSPASQVRVVVAVAASVDNIVVLFLEATKKKVKGGAETIVSKHKRWVAVRCLQGLSEPFPCRLGRLS